MASPRIVVVCHIQCIPGHLEKAVLYHFGSFSAVLCVFITVADLVPNQVCDRSPTQQLSGLSVPKWSKAFNADLELV